jgi:hypothetical protein
VFRVPFTEVNRALKAVNAPPALDYFDVFVESPQGKEFNDKYPEVIKLARGTTWTNSRKRYARRRCGSEQRNR